MREHDDGGPCVDETAASCIWGAALRRIGRRPSRTSRPAARSGVRRPFGALGLVKRVNADAGFHARRPRPAQSKRLSSGTATPTAKRGAPWEFFTRPRLRRPRGHVGVPGVPVAVGGLPWPSSTAVVTGDSAPWQLPSSGPSFSWPWNGSSHLARRRRMRMKRCPAAARHAAWAARSPSSSRSPIFPSTNGCPSIPAALSSGRRG